MARRGRHELAWSVALALFAVAAGALATGASGGWDGTAYRLFYLVGAILDVPVLALGTVYLLWGRRAGDAAAWATAAGGGFAAGVMVSTRFTQALPAHRLAQGSHVLGVLPRAMAGVASGGATLVIVGGALWSVARGRWVARARPALGGRRALGTVVVAAGTLVTGASGLLNSVADQMTAFAVTLAIGVAVLFVGFLLASSPGPAPPSSLPGPALAPAELVSPTGRAAPGEALSPSARAATRPRT